METVRAEIYVKGRVQGVAYRAFADREANGLGLLGYCKNLPNGHVFVDVEGNRMVVEQFIERLWIGPPAAEINDIQINWQEPNGHCQDFTIRL